MAKVGVLGSIKVSEEDGLDSYIKNVGLRVSIYTTTQKEIQIYEIVGELNDLIDEVKAFATSIRDYKNGNFKIVTIKSEVNYGLNKDNVCLHLNYLKVL